MIWMFFYPLPSSLFVCCRKISWNSILATDILISRLEVSPYWILLIKSVFVVIQPINQPTFHSIHQQQEKLAEIHYAKWMLLLDMVVGWTFIVEPLTFVCIKNRWKLFILFSLFSRRQNYTSLHSMAGAFRRGETRSRDHQYKVRSMPISIRFQPAS